MISRTDAGLVAETALMLVALVAAAGRWAALGG